MRKLIQLVLTVLVVGGMFAGKALAAAGEIVFVNPSEKVAKVERRDDESMRDYVIVSPFDLVDPLYTPMVGECVYFDPDRGRRASNVYYTGISNGPDDDCAPKAK